MSCVFPGSFLLDLTPGVHPPGSAGGRPRHARGDAGEDLEAAGENLGRGGRLRRGTGQVRKGKSQASPTQPPCMQPFFPHQIREFSVFGHPRIRRLPHR